jgi:uncharacterized membrane-anchored protein YjiN (DUF445 family)
MILLYDELKKNSISGDTAILTDNVTVAIGLIHQAMSIYTDGLTAKNRLFNNHGQRSFLALTDALEMVAKNRDGFADARYAYEISQKITKVIKSNEQKIEEFKQGWDKEKQEKEDVKQENELLAEKIRQQEAKFAKRLAQDKNKLRAEFNQIFTNQSHHPGFFTSIINNEVYKTIVAAKKKDPNYEECFDDEQVFDDIAFEVYCTQKPH